MVVMPASGKLNLALEVTGRVPSGLHTLDSVVVHLDWHDLLGVRLVNAETSVRIGGRTDGVPGGAANLATVAADALLRHAEDRRGAELWLHKRLPTRAGVGGGSADAAAALRATAAELRRCGAHIDEAALHAIATGLGSDVPSQLAGGTLRVRGTGERLSALPALDLHVVVVVAGQSSTAAVYAAVLDHERHADGRSERLSRALLDGSPPDPALLGSALEPAAFRVNPALADAVTRIRSLRKDVSWHLTGSGGAVFALADGAGAARRLAAQMTAAGWEARTCRTVQG